MKRQEEEKKQDEKKLDDELLSSEDEQRGKGSNAMDFGSSAERKTSNTQYHRGAVKKKISINFIDDTLLAVTDNKLKNSEELSSTSQDQRGEHVINES